MLQALDWLPRTEGSVRLNLERRRERTRVAALEQAGAARLKFPRMHGAEACEAVLINTAGGLTGGDRFTIAVAPGPGAGATVTAAAAESLHLARAGSAAGT